MPWCAQAQDALGSYDVIRYDIGWKHSITVSACADSQKLKQEVQSMHCSVILSVSWNSSKKYQVSDEKPEIIGP